MKARKHAELIKQWADDDSLEIEIFNDGAWELSHFPFNDDRFEYRIKPTKPSINWDHVADEYKWMARDADGRTYLHETKPLSVQPDYNAWQETSGVASPEGFKSFRAGTCDWKDSLVKRPEVE